jgi:hypothetical protein
MFDDSPLIREIIEETRLKTMREVIVIGLETRFGTITPAVCEMLDGTTDEQRLRELNREAVLCASLDDFEARLASSPAP